MRRWTVILMMLAAGLTVIAAACGGATPAPQPIVPLGPAPTPFTSPYEGTYIGMLTYEYEDGSGRIVSDGFRITLTLRYIGTAKASLYHEITSVSVSDPFFGAQFPITLAPGDGNAWLPANPPTTPMNPSQQGEGIHIDFPNGTFLNVGMQAQAGSIHVSSDGRLISNSLDPAIQDDTWYAWDKKGKAFAFASHVVGRDSVAGKSTFKEKSWSLTKSAR